MHSTSHCLLVWLQAIKEKEGFEFARDTFDGLLPKLLQGIVDGLIVTTILELDPVIVVHVILEPA